MAEKHKATVLVVDDDQGHRTILLALINGWGYKAAGADDGTKAVTLAREKPFDLILMDVRMAVMGGIEALKEIKAYNPSIPILIMTAYSNVESAVEAIKAGAYDYLTKPLDFDLLRMTMERALEHVSLKAENQELRDRLVSSFAPRSIVGRSEAMRRLMETVAMVAPSEATVLITGQSGTGKELVAKAIHFNSPRRNGPLVIVNCAALSETLLESELFGHEKGAFTGADKRREGRFMQANKGTHLPVEKAEGDRVFAGTINESGSFVYRVTAEANNSTLARIIHAVEEAQGSRAPTQRFVDQFARYYTPSVFALALAVAVLPPLVSGFPWMDWIYRALVLLVIACPCALVISTPVSIVSGLAAAAKKGILIKGGVYLEDGRKLRWLALDKTGTLTHGKPVQTDFIPWGDADATSARALAASLAARSDHPVSKALAVSANQDDVILQEVNDFAALPGKGVQGRIGPDSYYLANHRMIEELGICSPELEERLFALEKQGKSAVILADTRRVLAMFAVADTVKESSRKAIVELHELGVKTVMLTGDNIHTAEAIAAQVGTDRVLGGLLPEDKLREIESMVSPDAKVGMVGDGINDAPALARADIGFAMGAAGSDTAIETADVAIMDDDLRKIPAFIRLSKATADVLKQNIILALGIKAAFLVLTLTGQVTMWMAVFADMGTSLLVVFNGLRLLRK